MEESSSGGFVSLSNFNDSFQFNVKSTEKSIKNIYYSGMSEGLKIWSGE
jgi:hypothetical protein